jgi:hypothetical protein
MNPAEYDKNFALEATNSNVKGAKVLWNKEICSLDDPQRAIFHIPNEYVDNEERKGKKISEKSYRKHYLIEPLQSETVTLSEHHKAILDARAATGDFTLKHADKEALDVVVYRDRASFSHIHRPSISTQKGHYTYRRGSDVSLDAIQEDEKSESKHENQKAGVSPVHSIGMFPSSPASDARAKSPFDNATPISKIKIGDDDGDDNQSPTPSGTGAQRKTK